MIGPSINMKSKSSRWHIAVNEIQNHSQYHYYLKTQINVHHHHRHQMIHRQTLSLPEESITEIPSDYVDPNDGHTSHTKYYVLENGILYFYLHITNAYSIEARMERLNTC